MPFSLLRPALLVAICVAVYCNSLNVPFVFDDLAAIVENPQVRSSGSIWETLVPRKQSDITTAGRPLATLVVALNYRVAGDNVWGYHAVNIAIHAAATLLLFGIVRRTLLLRLPDAPALNRALPADWFAFFVALLWAVHPLQTEAVTYIIQRVESLAGAAILLTLYCVIRGRTSPRRVAWYAAAILACALGMGVKETVAVAPLLVLLYDRTFVAGSFARALRKRRWLYAGLAASWAILAVLLASSPRIDMAARAVGELGHLEYLRIQCWAIVRYLQLALWPVGLTFDYGGPFFGGRFAETWPQVLPQALLVTGLLAATLVAMLRWPALGLLGAWFFVILAPSSSVVPIPLETVAEHRMYLPLAAVVVGLVAIVDRLADQARGSAKWLASVAWSTVLLLMANGLSAATVLRNVDYRDAITLWRDTVEKRPDNARARTALGVGLLRRGELEAGIAALRGAIATQDTYAEAYYNLGAALSMAGREEEAEAIWRTTIDINPKMLLAYAGLAERLVTRGQYATAEEVCRAALRADDTFQDVRLTLARALLGLERNEEALAEAQRAAQDDPTSARAFNLQGRALRSLGRIEDAVAAFRRAVELDPGFTNARENLRDAEARLK